MGFRPLRSTHPPSPRGPRDLTAEYHEPRIQKRRDSRDRRGRRDRRQDRESDHSPYSRREYSSNESAHVNSYRPVYSPRRSEPARDSTYLYRSRSITPNPAFDRQTFTKAASLVPKNSSNQDIRKELICRTTKSTPPVASIGSAIHPSRIARVKASTTHITGPYLSKERIHMSPTSPMGSPQELAPVSLPGPTSFAMDENDSRDPESLLGVVGREMAEEAAKLSDLKSQLRRAEKRLAQRNVDFQSMEKHHLKFPVVKEQSLASKKEAEKHVNALRLEVTKQEVKFLTVSSKTAKQSLPVIIAQAQGGGILVEKLDQVVETLKQQQAVISQLQKDNEVSKSSEECLKAEVQSLKSQIQAILPSQQSKINASVTKVRDDFDTRYKLVNEKSEKHTEDIKTLGHRTATESSRVMDLQRRVILLELPKKIDVQSEIESSLKDIQERLQSVEAVTPRPSPDVATKKDLQALQGRVKGLERSPSPKPVQLSDLDASSLRSRLEIIERQLGNCPSGARVAKSLEDRVKDLSESIGTFTVESKLEGPMTNNMELLKDQIEAVAYSCEILQGLVGISVNDCALRIQKDLRGELEIWLQTGLATATQDIDTIRSELATTSKAIDTFRTEQDSVIGRFNALSESTNGIETTVTTNVEKKVTVAVQALETAFRRGMQTVHDMLPPFKELNDLCHGLDHLTKRVDKIHTADLAHHMLGQVAAVFPNLTNTEKTIKDLLERVLELEKKIAKLAAQRQDIHSTDIDTLQKQTQREDIHSTDIDTLQKQILVFDEKIGGLEAVIKQIVVLETKLKSEELKTLVLEQLEHNKDAIASTFVESDSKMHNLLEAAKDELLEAATESLKETAKEAAKETAKEAADAAMTYFSKRVDDLVVADSQGPKLSRELTKLAEMVHGHDKQLQLLWLRPVPATTPTRSVPPTSVPARVPSPHLQPPQASEQAGTLLRRESNGQPQNLLSANKPKPSSTSRSPFLQPKRQSSLASVASEPSTKSQKRKHAATNGSNKVPSPYRKRHRPARPTVKNSEDEDDDVELDEDGGEEIGAPQMGNDDEE